MTEGNWEIFENKPALINCANIEIVSEDGLWICLVQNNGMIGSVEGLSNARVIQQAPKLLSACKEALRYVTIEEPIYDILIEVIKKAENG